MNYPTNVSRVPARFLIHVGLIVSGAMVIMSAPNLALAATIDRELSVGMSGADVTALQTFLAQDSTLYPEGLITGYYGNLTKAAVARFQARNGIAAVGRVGPVTLPVLNMKMAGTVTTTGDIYAPTITSISLGVGSTTSLINWSTNELARGVVYYSTQPLTTYEHLHSVDVSGTTAMMDTSLRMNQSVALGGLTPGTTYNYLLYATDGNGNVTITLPSTFRTLP